MKIVETINLLQKRFISLTFGGSKSKIGKGQLDTLVWPLPRVAIMAQVHVGARPQIWSQETERLRLGSYNLL
jgi:hypothetical protein